MKELNFDSLFSKLALKIPLIGKFMQNYYMNHATFRRFTKYAVSTFVIYWVVKGPLIWLLTLLLPSINLFLIIVPDYVLSAFVVGVLVSLIGFLLSEGWIWRKSQK